MAVNEPIEYRRPSLVRRAVLAYRRNRVVVISTAAVLAVIVTATGLVYRAAQGERREAERARAGAIVSGARTVAERDPLEASLLLIELPAGASPPDATAVAVGLARTMVPAVLLSGHVQSVMEASFSPDGRRVVTTSFDGTARVWRVDLHDVLDHLRARTTACLSNADRVRYLGEDDATAITRRDQCERRYGREPGAREPGSSR